jgi:hypothetical protein
VRGMGNTVTASAPKSRLRSRALHKLQIIERYNHRTKRCCVLSQTVCPSPSRGDSPSMRLEGCPDWPGYGSLHPPI